jgi:hypothetical protein
VLSSAPEKVGFCEAFSVRDVGVECWKHFVRDRRKPGFTAGGFALATWDALRPWLAKLLIR